MADYYTKFSVMLPLPDESAQTYALTLARQARAGGAGEKLPDDFPDSLAASLADWIFEIEAEATSGSCGLWLHSDFGGVDAVGALLQHLLQKIQSLRLGRV